MIFAVSGRNEANKSVTLKQYHWNLSVASLKVIGAATIILWDSAIMTKSDKLDRIAGGSVPVGSNNQTWTDPDPISVFDDQD